MRKKARRHCEPLIHRRKNQISRGHSPKFIFDKTEAKIGLLCLVTQRHFCRYFVIWRRHTRRGSKRADLSNILLDNFVLIPSRSKCSHIHDISPQVLQLQFRRDFAFQDGADDVGNEIDQFLAVIREGALHIQLFSKLSQSEHKKEKAPWPEMGRGRKHNSKIIGTMYGGLSL